MKRGHGRIAYILKSPAVATLPLTPRAAHLNGLAINQKTEMVLTPPPGLVVK